MGALDKRDRDALAASLGGANKARRVGAEDDYGSAQQRIEVNKRKAVLGNAARRMTDKAMDAVRYPEERLSDMADKANTRNWNKFTNSLFDSSAIAKATSGPMLRR